MTINMRCPLNTLIGYGHAAWGILQELHKQGEIVNLYPIGHPFLSSGDPKIIRICTERPYDASAAALAIWHEFDLIPNLIGKGKHVGFPFFEVNKMDALRIKHLNACDHAWSGARCGTSSGSVPGRATQSTYSSPRV